MITFVVLRHGQAESRAISDYERPLTHQGQQDCRFVAERLSLDQERFGQKNPLEAIYHSPYLRTTQTANIIHSHIESSDESVKLPIYPAESLMSNESVDSVTQWISSLTQRRMLLVSHQPLVSALIAWLVDGAQPNDYSIISRYPMHPASFAILECDVIARGCCDLVSLNHLNN